ncbi:MAG: hypothetical protein ABR95_00135 [Sphingobacteriales bacterium BACL12 MAG-120813-bin55]|nr:MAG: hypothetical protein ABR94_08500 [Sphingobacteriales bacterium BACL12 MAG-120802-bin5]KRP13533.1 MAG: hypothetical protein ABR95_00135 [Sphingobacteriales bacterium BACL12 MAG-120813-bin55]
MGNKEFNNEHIKVQLSNWEISPSDKVWEGIHQTLETDRKAIAAENRRKALWSAVAVLLLTLTGMLFFQSSPGMQAYEGIGSPPITPLNRNSQNTYNQQLTNQAESITSDKNAPGFIGGAEASDQAIAATNVAEMQQAAPTDEVSLVAELPLSAIYEESASEHLQLPEAPTPSDDHTTILAQSATEIASTDVPRESNDKSGYAVDRGIAADDADYAHDFDGITELINETDNSLHGFYAGASAGYNATTMLINRAILSNYEGATNSFRLLPSKGLVLGYFINDRFSIQAEYAHNIAEGVAINTAEGANDRQLNLSLYFDQFPVMFKFRTPTYHAAINRPGSLNLIAGLQYNKLRAYKIPQERRYEISPNDVIFEPTSWSFLAGTEYELFVFPNWMVSLGVEASMSQDLSTFDNPLSNYPKHSFTTGIRGGIYYYLGRD